MASKEDCQVTECLNSTFVADIESYTIQLTHGGSTASGSWSGMSYELYGHLIDLHGNVIKEFPPCEKDNQFVNLDCNPRDTINIKEALLSLEIDLDEEVDDYELVAGGNSIYQNITLRYEGIVSMLIIKYSHNVVTLEVEYSIRFKPILGSDFSVNFYYDRISDTHIRTMGFASLRCILTIDGLIGAFDFQTLLLTFTSGLALLATANVLADFLMTYVLPQRAEYNHAKYVNTAQYTDFLYGNAREFIHNSDIYEGLLTDPTQDIEFSEMSHSQNYK